MKTLFLLLLLSFAQRSALAVELPDAALKDEFSYLEDRHGEKALAWVKKQNERTAAVLVADPRYLQVYNELLADQQRSASTDLDGRSLRTDGLTSIFNGWIFTSTQGPEHPRGLWSRTSVKSYVAGHPRWELLLDLDALSRAEGRLYSQISLYPGFCRPSADRCMVQLMEEGSKSSAREFDFKERRFVENGFISTSRYSCCTWEDDDTLLLDQAIANPSSDGTLGQRILKRWRRGQPATSAQEMFRVPLDPSGAKDEFVSADDYLIAGMTTTKGRMVFFKAIQTSVGGHTANRFWLWRNQKKVVPLLLPKAINVQGMYGDEVVIDLQEDWAVGGRTIPAGSYLSVPIEEAVNGIRNVHVIRLPGQREALNQLKIVQDGVLVLLTRNVRGELWAYRFDQNRWAPHRILVPQNGVVGPQIIGHESVNVAIVSYQDLIHPAANFAVRADDGSAAALPSAPASFDVAKWVMEQREATSHDGTPIPYFIAQPRALKYDGKAPALLHSYGALGGSTLPNYNASFAPWLARGGVYVTANIRGGSEFGPSWHVVRAERRKTYEDFVAVAQDLIHRKVTSPSRLGIYGHSAGGLLTGVMATMHPELFGAAVMSAPVTDFTRGYLNVGGQAFIDTEFGRLNVPQERAFLEQTWPFQNLREIDYFPEPLVLTSTPDMQVYPGHPRRFSAKAERLGLPYLFYETAEGGHALGATAEQRAAVDAMVNIYFIRRLMAD